MRSHLESDFDCALRILHRAKAPGILAGPGARRAIDDIRELAIGLGAAVLTTPDAKSFIDETDPSAGGAFSFGANDTSRAIVERCDAVVAVGTNLGEFASERGRALSRAAIVFVADDPRELPVGIEVEAAVFGDVAAIVCALARAIGRSTPRGRWFEEIATARLPIAPASSAPPTRGISSARAPSASNGPEPSASNDAATSASSASSPPTRRARRRSMDPAAAMRALGDALPPRARLACDVTSAALHAIHDLKFRRQQRLWLQLEKSACMGSALAAGIGVRLASELPTVVVIGDWGFMMGGSELHTVASLGIGRFVVVVWSNSGGALIRAGVRAQGLDVPAEIHSWRAPSFERVAQGYDVRALTVCTARGLGRAVAVALRAAFPVVVDAIVDPDAAIPGAGARYDQLTDSATSR